MSHLPFPRSTYHTHTLANGLSLLILPMPERMMAVVNLMYLVGSRDELPTRTGMAHFLEHIMFGGSKHIPNYDGPLQVVGGKNNAYTCNDVTNYWCKLPAEKLEVAFWLESDRLMAPSYDDSTVETQRKVVIEEFKQGCEEKPYGDVWHLLSAQAYQVHPYSWPTIGKAIDHIKEVTREEIKGFGKRFYTPSNAVLVVAGNVDPDAVCKLAEKWFAPITGCKREKRALPQEPLQQGASQQRVIRNVPQDALFKTYHIPGRQDKDYGSLQLLSTFLGEGKSSRLHQSLVESQMIFSEIGVSITDSFDPGLFIIEGKIQKGVSFERAEAALQQQLDRTIQEGVDECMLQKVKNQETSGYLFAHANMIERAEMGAYAHFLGSPDFFTEELTQMRKRCTAELQSTANRVFQLNNSHTLYYQQESRSRL